MANLPLPPSGVKHRVRAEVEGKRELGRALRGASRISRGERSLQRPRDVAPQQTSRRVGVSSA